MTVRAVGAEGQDDVGTNPSDVSRDASDDVARVRSIELLILVVEQRDLAYAQRRRGGAQLRLSNPAESRWSWMAIVARTIAAVAAAVSAGGGEQKDVHAFRAVFRERAPETQRLVVGMGEYGHQSSRVHEQSPPRPGQAAAPNTMQQTARH